MSKNIGATTQVPVQWRFEHRDDSRGCEETDKATQWTYGKPEKAEGGSGNYRPADQDEVAYDIMRALRQIALKNTPHTVCVDAMFKQDCATVNTSRTRNVHGVHHITVYSNDREFIAQMQSRVSVVA